MNAEDSTQALIEAMLNEPSPSRQSKLIEELGDRRAIEAVEPLMQQAASNGFQSGPAIRALGNIGDPRAVSVLIEVCRHPGLAWIAKDALVQIGAAAVEPLTAALQHAHPDIRFVAVRTLGQLADPRAAAPLETLIQAETDETNRQLARTTLKSLLLAGLCSDDLAVRRQAIGGLKRLGDARTIEALQALADDETNPDLCRDAQGVIIDLLQHVEIDPFEAHQFPPRSKKTNLLINQLQRNFSVPVGDASDLAGEASTVAALQEAASTHPDSSARALAQQALWLLCLDYVRHPDPSARLMALQGLGWFDSPEALRLLSQLAQYDPAERVRTAAREANAR